MQQPSIFCCYYLSYCLKYLSYYQLAKVEEPLIYSMETREILDTLQDIVSEVVPDVTRDQWESQSVSGLVVKYKVRLKVY